MAVAAVTFSISLSSKIKGAVSNSIVAFADTAFVLNTLNTAAAASVIVTVIVSALPESSDTSIDFIIEVVAVGTVYNTVALVIVVFFAGALFFAFMKGLSEGTLDKYWN